MDAGDTYDDTGGGEQMEEDGKKEDVDTNGFTDLDKEKMKKVREMNFDSGSILLLEMVEQMEVRFQYNGTVEEL